MTSPPDIVLLGAEWPSRALLRAQLIEEGFDVLATDSWASMRRALRPGLKPKLAIVDLKGLADPETILQELRVLMKPARVLVLTALGAVPHERIESVGFRVLRRPVVIEDVVAAATQAMM
ncbi:MAG: hypothetical protein DMG00_00395 [Acidobacteria bacterium]|nr:MAG: hypothetical protein DMG00_00395 [Acidobacteriota bacterium]